MPGLSVPDLSFHAFRIRKDFFKVKITGKWFNYGILFFVMGMDANMYKNQMLYSPTANYAQCSLSHKLLGGHPP